jgi:hypothetical protein
MGIADVPPRGGMDKINVPPDQLADRIAIASIDPCPQQLLIGLSIHHISNVRSDDQANRRI